MNEKFDSVAFRNACGLWASGVSIVTATDNLGNPYGLTMNAVTSLSLTPPMFLVCVDNGSDTLAPMLETQLFCINVLSSSQQLISNKFAKKGNNKFEDVAWTPGDNGTPVITDALLSIECIIYNVYEGGDHQIVCGLVKTFVASEKNTKPLLYFGGNYQEFLS